MKIIPRILMNGNCKEAIEFYSNAFNASVGKVIKYQDGGVLEENKKDLIMHSELNILDNQIHLSDDMNGKAIVGNQVSFTVIMNDINEVKETFDKLQQGGAVIMEPMETFFSPCHCAVTDKFGITWQINCLKK